MSLALPACGTLWPSSAKADSRLEMRAGARVSRSRSGGILNEDGTVNRPALGAIVFGDKSQLTKLNETVWPYIRRQLEEAIAQHRATASGVLVVEAAVVIEAGWLDMFDEVWMLFASPDIARTRLMLRNNFSEEEAQRRISAQLSHEERLAKASAFGKRVVQMRNDGSTAELAAVVEAEWRQLQLRIEPQLEPRSRV